MKGSSLGNWLLLRNAALVPSKRTMQDAAWVSAHVTEWHRDTTGIVSIITGLARYADRYCERYDSQLGDDAVLGGAWLYALHAVHDLLNGELHGLDAGTLDALLCNMATLNGFGGEL